MTEYEQLLQDAYDRDLFVHEDAFIESGADGMIYDTLIYLSDRLVSCREKTCILVEEIAHYDVNTGNILDQTKAWNRQQELKARRLAFDRMSVLQGLIESFKVGDRNLYEVAERLNVTEPFLAEALKDYRARFPKGVQVDNFWISFRPYLTIAEVE